MSGRGNLMKPEAKPSLCLRRAGKGKRSLTQAEATSHCWREETVNLEVLPICSFMAHFPLNFQQLIGLKGINSPARKKQSASQYLLTTYYMSGSLLSAGDTVEDKLGKAPAHRKLSLYWGRAENTHKQVR